MLPNGCKWHYFAHKFNTAKEWLKLQDSTGKVIASFLLHRDAAGKILTTSDPIVLNLYEDASKLDIFVSLMNSKDVTEQDRKTLRFIWHKFKKFEGPAYVGRPKAILATASTKQLKIFKQKLETPEGQRWYRSQFEETALDYAIADFMEDQNPVDLTKLN